MSTTCDRYENVKGESFYLYRRNLIEQFGKNLLRIFTLQLTNFVKLLSLIISVNWGRWYLLVLSGMLPKQNYSILFEKKLTVASWYPSHSKLVIKRVFMWQLETQPFLSSYIWLAYIFERSHGAMYRGLQWNGIQEVFQNIVYCRCGNKNIMISINIGMMTIAM